MQYREFGKLGWQVSTLGFGAMRLPILNGKQSDIDEPEATKMIRHAIDQGVNYIDTAYIYHGSKSESFLGKALQDGYREKVKLATKLPSWIVSTADDFDKYLDEQLGFLQTDTIECYLLHGLNDKQWPKLLDLGVLDWAERAKADGRIHHLGFSFHDHLDDFKEIIDAYDKWEFCQIQYNFMDIEFQAGKEGLLYAAEKGLGIIIMEPLRGGQFCRNLPDSVTDLWAKAPIQRSPTDWALQWLWNQPEISVVLSGMTTMKHVEENLESAGRAEAGSLSKQELAIVEEVRQEYLQATKIDCTSCKYCLPCEANVNIPAIFQRYNDAYRYNDMNAAKRFYQVFLTNETADLCEECYECEEHCPQDIAIVEWLQQCHKEYTS